MSEKDGGPAFPHLKPMFRYDGNGIATEVAPELKGRNLYTPTLHSPFQSLCRHRQHRRPGRHQLV